MRGQNGTRGGGERSQRLRKAHPGEADCVKGMPTSLRCRGKNILKLRFNYSGVWGKWLNKFSCSSKAYGLAMGNSNAKEVEEVAKKPFYIKVHVLIVGGLGVVHSHGHSF